MPMLSVNFRQQYVHALSVLNFLTRIIQLRHTVHCAEKMCVVAQVLSLIRRPFVGEIAWQLTWVQTVYGQDVKESTAALRTSYEYWIMHVIFDCSCVTVRIAQECCCRQQVHYRLILYGCCITCYVQIHRVQQTHSRSPMSICPTVSKYYLHEILHNILRSHLFYCT